ncbi:hypothetical protein F383_12762 [Gossypium arboreum]|uniref:Uncharacterized protein n=1 Tax=Gossypium arboreum TaxID=29729 RepID=A0A0B0N9L8_GOSAR|nr:hypothetical protein F383_12762 [Gossypium arboreum]
MPTSRYGLTLNHISKILCYDICILAIPIVRTGIFRCRHIIKTFLDFS